MRRSGVDAVAVAASATAVVDCTSVPVWSLLKSALLEKRVRAMLAGLLELPLLLVSVLVVLGAGGQHGLGGEGLEDGDGLMLASENENNGRGDAD